MHLKGCQKLMKKLLVLAVALIAMISLSSCNHSTKPSSHSADLNLTSNNNSSNSIENTNLTTKKNYKINDDISIGNNSDIVVKPGIFTNETCDSSSEYPLGVDNNGNIVKFNRKTNCLESLDSNGDTSVLMNIMNSRNNHVYQIKKAGDLVVWSECPYGDNTSLDKTNGANWGIYYADLKTKAITKVDGYKGVAVQLNAQDCYLCPDQIFINEDYITFVTFDYNLSSEVTNVVKLYSISTQKLEILDYLNDDLSNHYFTCSNASDGHIAWSRELLNQDGTYTSSMYLYNINTKTKLKLVTDENVGFPVLCKNHLYAQGDPNKTFYDGEVCIYDIEKNEWVYKINNGYSQYKSHENVYLTQLEADDKYLLWSSGINYGITIFNSEDNKLYNIVPVPDHKSVDDIRGPTLLDGGLLVWNSVNHGDNNMTDKNPLSYCILKQ